MARARDVASAGAPAAAPEPHHDAAEAAGGARAALRAATRTTEGWGGIAVMLVALVVVMAITTPTFRTEANLWNVLRANAVLIVLTAGMTFVVIARGIDLSVGSMLALISILLGWMLTHDVPGVLAVLLAFGGGLLLGAGVNGVLIGKVGVSFFVVTLGTLSIFRSVANVIGEGQTTPLFGVGGFGLTDTLGNGNVGTVPVPVIVAAVVVVAAWATLRWTVFGRAVYAAGGNPEAARLAGISLTRIQIAVYGLNGLLVGVAAVLFTGRIQAATAQSGVGLELQAIAAVLLGGISYAGGAGSVIGAVVGALLIGVVDNALDLRGVNDFWQGAVTGVILIAAVWLDRFRRRT